MDSMLPPSKYEFSVKVVGEETGMEFSGDFVYHRLTIGDKIELQKWLSGVMKEDEKSESVRSSYITLGIIRFGCTSCPDWFRDSDYGINLYDFNVISEIFNQKTIKESEWTEKLKEKAGKVGMAANSNE